MPGPVYMPDETDYENDTNTFDPSSDHDPATVGIMPPEVVEQLTEGDVEAAPVADRTLEDFTDAELRQEASLLQIEGRSKMDRDELIAAVREATATHG